MGRIFPHVLAYPDQNAEKSCKGEGEEGEGELSRIEHAAKQQLKIYKLAVVSNSRKLPKTLLGLETKTRK